jgi:cation transport protein ChaC
MAYSFSPEHLQEMLEYLDVREIDGYSRLYLPVYENEQVTAPIISKALVYIGTIDNPSFVGPESIEKVAGRIQMCSGPSGENREYLHNLAQSIRELAPLSRDRHVWDIEERLKELIDTEL